MAYGPHTIIEHQAQKLLLRWVPKWYEVFYDPARDNFDERLTKGFKPVPLGYLRLLTQCRQLAMYAHATTQASSIPFRANLAGHFAALKRDYYVPETGGWRFSIHEDGTPADTTYDLYTLSFVIFALAHYFRATQDAEAKQLAVATLEFIDKNFRVDGWAGYCEALDETLKPLPKMRRQNPHMHLLEACLFATDIWDEPIFNDIADQMVALFLIYFYDVDKKSLCEWFNDDLTPHAEKGHIVEPGHYYEWVWLLKKHARLSQEPELYDVICFKLLDWANTYGWDSEFGGIYDELDTGGAVVSETKRIWPFTEAIKANALMLKDHPLIKKERKQRIADMIEILRDKYIEERGFWTERLKRDLSPATDYMPGTTPYHVYFGIMETRDILRARGKSVSWMPAIYGFVYGLRRKLSMIVRSWRRRASTG